MDSNLPAAYHAPYRQWVNGLTLPPGITNPTTKSERANARVHAAMDQSMATAFCEGFMPVDIPVVVISAEVGLFGDERLNEAFVLAHRLLAKSFVNGEWVLAAGVGHNIIPEQADLVVQSIGKVLDSER
jgi:hypothetical protein